MGEQGAFISWQKSMKQPVPPVAPGGFAIMLASVSGAWMEEVGVAMLPPEVMQAQ
jgi:hypothetical protein